MRIRCRRGDESCGCGQIDREALEQLDRAPPAPAPTARRRLRTRVRGWHTPGNAPAAAPAPAPVPAPRGAPDHGSRRRHRARAAVQPPHPSRESLPGSASNSAASIRITASPRSVRGAQQFAPARPALPGFRRHVYAGKTREFACASTGPAASSPRSRLPMPTMSVMGRSALDVQFQEMRGAGNARIVVADRLLAAQAQAVIVQIEPAPARIRAGPARWCSGSARWAARSAPISIVPSASMR